MKKPQKNSAFNFGAAGWGTILYCLLMFFFYVGMVNDGTNVLAPTVAENIGCPAGTLIQMNGYAGMVGVLGFILVGQVNRRIGARVTSSLSTIIAGIAYIVCANSTSIPMYFIAMCVVVTGIMSAGYIAGGTLVATWFPKKKGIVMGYTTMGHNFASAFYVVILTGLMAVTGGIQGGSVPIGIAAIVLGIAGAFFIRNTPKERGLNPDNVTDSVYAREYYTAKDENSDGDWTVKGLLSKRETWLAAITTGAFQICSVGVMCQLVTRNIRDFGMVPGRALALMTVVALIGVVGSWLIGVIDDRIGTKRTMQFFGLWYAVALTFNFMADGVGPAFYISIFMIGMGIGGSANFTTSLPTSIFGRQEFDKVNAVIFPLQGLVTSLCFIINGVVTNVIGNLSVAYMIFAGVALVNVALVSIVNEHRYNKDWNTGAVEDEDEIFFGAAEVEEAVCQ
jgi:OFA family oxalate/formate antiporter-like MFS transporter